MKYVCVGGDANPVRMCNSDCECQGKRLRWRPGLIAMDEWVRTGPSAVNGTAKFERWQLVKKVPSRQFPDWEYAYSAGRFRFRFRESAPVGAMECPLFNSAGAYSCGRLRRVEAGSRSQTACRNDFLIPVSDSDGHRHAVTKSSFMYLLFKLPYFI